MELTDGVFVSNVSTEEWQPDNDPAGEVHVMCDRDGVQAGFTRFPPGGDEPVTWKLPARETLFVLEGAARIEIAGGPTLELGVGDLVSMPKGSETTWYLTTPFKEAWVLAGE